MPGGSKKKKRFIDKKHAQKFYLLNRSQRDPLTADERAPQHVLYDSGSRQNGAENDGQGSDKPKSRKEEEQKYNIFFDDDYDYLQHLKDLKDVSLVPMAAIDMSSTEKSNNPEVQGKPKLSLPSSVFASNVEEDIGLLNRAAPIRGPQPDLDPDILATLDSDYEMSDDEDGLEDDFVIKATAKTGDGASGDSEDDYSSENQEIESDGSNCSEETSSFEGTMHTFTEEETKSRFTNYSMSSSVLRRNEGLTLLDDRFEKIFEEYDEEQIGALDGDEVDGFLQPGDDLLEQVIANFKKGQIDSELTDLRKEARTEDRDNLTDDSSDEEKDEIVKMVLEEPTEKWDCESILSTYSNLYNHPKLIKEPRNVKPIRVSRRTGMPIGVINDSVLTASALERFNAETSNPSEPSVMSKSMPKRDKDETPEEKRERKQAVKQQRRERRVEKKANTICFNEEKRKQAKAMLNLQQNMNGIKLS